MLLAGNGYADQLRQETGIDRFGRLQFPRFDLYLFGIENDLAGGVEALRGFGRAIEEIGRGVSRAEGIAGEENVTGAGGQFGFGVGAEDFAVGSGEDEADRLFFAVDGLEGKGKRQRYDNSREAKVQAKGLLYKA
jgi:hypothetical protein